MTKNYRKKRLIDIYFVLYLAALLFLLPNREDMANKPGEDYISPVYQHSFTLYPEKTSLLCSVINDSAGLKILSLDSVNTIFYTGDVKDVRFEFYIEDRIRGVKSAILKNGDNSGKYFRIEEYSDQNAAVFYWLPPLDELTNKTYLVDVIAYATDQSSDNGAELKVRTKFSLNVIFLNSGFQSDTSSLVITESGDSIILNTQSQNQQFEVPRQVELFSQSSTIESIAYENWSKQIFLNGLITRDIENILPLRVVREPDVNGGTAEIHDMKGSTIIINGKTPYAGNMKVELAMIRKADRKKISAEFRVQPKAIGQAKFNNEMYPEFSYTIKPNLPILHGLETKTILKDNQRERIVSEGSADFEFIPDISDTGKILVLERYINNNLRDKNLITIKSIPDPQINRFGSDEPKKVKLETRSFGYYKGQENLIRALEIEGNGKYFQKFGSQQASDNEFIHTQYFEIVPKNPSEPFRFKVRGIDNRGKRTNIEAFSE